ncbi:MAG: hypothetical protein A2268_07435 [Candidatus Raymondbacteria bacterium RifOxyA12_full_50_37]|uniref:HTH gntR-type domain-containing protein n=1 Tax=Candidatus Raymondbacteria bacterium RIFOXYD12_FULL_49_13 TaxID=1817890 RepID=A0A1F7F5Z9_UNCRA|nr:MAG: hypothetical protein A2350_09190 [Candidatus Raymondbacteria bacterium RifOxyB12_full_50_8]OGJ89806.1 MAG: hypothetical protein A2268_07435 [Candidatus Raymondbacteria bacterium RifOxyA12_full_50_37]OGJ91214.1 MAG: hypothetical protein A2248_01580 [Candidatus Raymondbacteria bacterium RIFOXYA2_FULL_49_16]OGJ96150.1 MAG: hypothetical protein A2487_01535 [Candidatus Raymondbacteria bacterium RifOxyC12_full_50_8]OGJ97612.1 MAG: hypothetical protein A2453_02345 [Candidatus Raymondbacteria b
MKYIHLYELLKKEILEQKFAPGAKLPPINHLITDLKASYVTVRHALKLLQQEGLIKGVRSKGTFVRDLSGFAPFPQEKERYRVAVLTPEQLSRSMTEPYFNKIFWGIEDALSEMKGLAYAFSNKDKNLREILRELNVLQIHALITVGLEETGFRTELDRIAMPVVHTDIEEKCHTRSIITADNRQGGRLAFEKLRSLGHSKILFIEAFNQNIKKIDSTTLQRFKGAREAARRIGFRGLMRRSVSHERTTRVRDMRALLEECGAFTGLVFCSSTLFGIAKEYLENKPVDQTKPLDIVLFDLNDDPEFIHRKPVWFCKWDGQAMGKKAVQLAFGPRSAPGQTHYFPMFLQRNIQ